MSFLELMTDTHEAIEEEEMLTSKSVRGGMSVGNKKRHLILMKKKRNNTVPI